MVKGGSSLRIKASRLEVLVIIHQVSLQIRDRRLAIGRPMAIRYQVQAVHALEQVVLQGNLAFLLMVSLVARMVRVVTMLHVVQIARRNSCRIRRMPPIHFQIGVTILR